MFEVNSKKEYVYGKTKISVTTRTSNVTHDGEIEILLYPKYPLKKQSIKLLIDVIHLQSNRFVRITDLIGNGFNSSFQNQGFGTLIFNIGIQAIYEFFELSVGEKGADSIMVYGQMSDIDDPAELPLKAKCHQRREKFWLQFGFIVSEPGNPISKMKANLSDLSLFGMGETSNGTPKHLKLKDFWELNNPPILLQKDIGVLHKLNIADIEYCGPAISDIDKALELHLKHSKIAQNLILLSGTFSLGGVNFVILNLLGSFSFENLFACTLAMGFVWLYLWFVIDWSFLCQESYNRYKLLYQERRQKQLLIRDAIYSYEEKSNGVAWRLYEYLKKEEPQFAEEHFRKIAEDSKRQLFYHKTHDYYLFMKLAKSILASNKLN